MNALGTQTHNEDESLEGPETLLTVKQAGRILKYHRNTVLKLVQTGALPAVKIGRCWRIRRGALAQIAGLPG